MYKRKQYKKLRRKNESFLNVTSLRNNDSPKAGVSCLIHSGAQHLDFFFVCIRGIFGREARRAISAAYKLEGWSDAISPAINSTGMHSGVLPCINVHRNVLRSAVLRDYWQWCSGTVSTGEICAGGDRKRSVMAGFGQEVFSFSALKKLLQHWIEICTAESHLSALKRLLQGCTKIGIARVRLRIQYPTLTGHWCGDFWLRLVGITAARLAV